MQRVTGCCRHAASRGPRSSASSCTCCCAWMHSSNISTTTSWAAKLSTTLRACQRFPPCCISADVEMPSSAAVLQHTIIVFQWTNNTLLYVPIHSSRGLRLFSECWRHPFFFETCWRRLGIRWEWIKLGLIMSCGHWALGTIFTLACQWQSVVKMILMHTPVSYALGGWTTISSMGANCFYF